MAYTRVNWQNSPSHATPLSAENLNVMDAAIEELDGAVTDAEGTISTLESTVSDQATTISGLQTTVNGHTTSIGTLANLTTTEKSNLVGAINEVDADVSDVKEDLNDINDAFNKKYQIHGNLILTDSEPFVVGAAQITAKKYGNSIVLNGTAQSNVNPFIYLFGDEGTTKITLQAGKYIIYCPETTANCFLRVSYSSGRASTNVQTTDPIIIDLDTSENIVCLLRVVASSTFSNFKITPVIYKANSYDYSTPTMFGAVADGESDDSAAIKAAVALSNMVYIQSGTYAINSQIVLSSNKHLFGDGESSVLKAGGSFSGDSLVKVSQNGSNVSITDLKVYGLNSENSTEGGIYVGSGCHEIAIEKCIATNTGKDGIRIGRDSYNCSIDRCQVSLNTADGICVYAGCSNIKIIGCIAEHSGGIGIELEGRTGSTLDSTTITEANAIMNCIIENCKCSDCTDKSYLLINAHNCKMINCDSENSSIAPFDIIASTYCDIEVNSINDTKVFLVTPETAEPSLGLSTNLKLKLGTKGATSFGEIKYAEDSCFKINGEIDGQHITILENSKNVLFTDCNILNAGTSGTLVRPNITNDGLVIKNCIMRGGARIMRNFGTLTNSAMIASVEYKTADQTIAETGFAVNGNIKLS